LNHFTVFFKIIYYFRQGTCLKFAIHIQYAVFLSLGETPSVAIL